MESAQPADIILASASPRRRELLSLITDRFRVVPSAFDESSVPLDLRPDQHVICSASSKAADISASHPDAIVLGADTIVVIDNTILGKPIDEEDAARMLWMLSARTHYVYTGVAVVRGQVERSGYECTDVIFRELTPQIVSRYIATGEPMDKAGAYAIQGRGAVLIKGIRGCYSNVVGLPLHLLSTMLEEFGVGVLEQI